MDRGHLQQLERLLRPLASRIANMVSRAVVQLVDDAKGQQAVQLGALLGETVDDAEHFQPYGFASVPLAGAEAVVVFPNGDRSHPLVIAAADRRHRPTGADPGTVIVYNKDGAKITLKGADIEVQPGSGGQVYVRDEGGTTDKLVKLSEFNAHTHPTAGSGPPSPPTAPATGTTRLRAQ